MANSRLLCCLGGLLAGFASREESDQGSLLQMKRLDEAEIPRPVYAGHAWHLSEAGRRLLQPAPRNSGLVQEKAAVRKDPSSPCDFGEDGIMVHYVDGFFGPLEAESLSEEDCDLPCTRLRYANNGNDRTSPKADLLVTFPIRPQPPSNPRGAAALAHSMEAEGLFGSAHAWRYAGTSNTSLLSSVPWPYFGLPSWRAIRERSRGPHATEDFPSFADRLPAAVFVASNCHGTDRNSLITELVQRGVPIHSIGDCAPAGTKQPWPGEVKRSDKIGALRRYRVYLALENIIQPHYVTEKAIDGFAAGALPVYLGAPNIGEYLPDGSYIAATSAMTDAAAARSRGLDALAHKVKAALEDERVWIRYHDWRLQPTESLNAGALAKTWSWTEGIRDLCRMCRFAYASLTPGAAWDRRRQEVVGGARPPKRGDCGAWAAWRRQAAPAAEP